jgi:hypothetical protein
VVPDTDDLALARWEVATLTGRLRCVTDERDAAVLERDRSHELVRSLRASRPYRIGRVLADLADDPIRNGPSIAGRAARRLRRRPPRPVRPVPPATAPPATVPPATALPATVPPATALPATALPARVYVAVGLTLPAARELVKALRQRIVVDADHVPVVVTDQPALGDLRVPGVVLEYLPDPPTWARHNPAESWEALLAGRIAQLCRDHRAVDALVIDPRHPPTLAHLL